MCNKNEYVVITIYYKPRIACDNIAENLKTNIKNNDKFTRKS